LVTDLLSEHIKSGTLGYDNSINGARVVYEPVKGLILKGVYGTQRYFGTSMKKMVEELLKVLMQNLILMMFLLRWLNLKLN